MDHLRGSLVNVTLVGEALGVGVAAGMLVGSSLTLARPKPIANFFRRRLERAKALNWMGAQDAARNNTPGRVALVAAAGLVVAIIILFRVAPKVWGAAPPSTHHLVIGAVGAGGCVAVATYLLLDALARRNAPSLATWCCFGGLAAIAVACAAVAVAAIGAAP